MSLANVVYCLVTDPSFRDRAKVNLEAALADIQEHLTAEDLEVLGGIDWDAVTPRQGLRMEPNNPRWWGCQFKRLSIQPQSYTTG